MDTTFRAGGLASGIDTNTIVDELVKIQSRPLAVLTSKQKGFSTQVSQLGDVISKLQALETAAKSLGASGVVGLKSTTSPVHFSAVAGMGALPGRYSIEVQELAQSAKARSLGFVSGSAAVTGGTLTLGINGTNYPLTISDGDSLATVAGNINALGAAVRATVISDGTQSYLAFSTTDTGFTVGADPASALTLTETSTGALGHPLGAAVTQSARNAVIVVDGLRVERRGNDISDVIPGVALNLQTKAPGTTEEIVLSSDVDATAGGIQKFVDAYNAITRVLQASNAPSVNTDRTSTLTGISSVRGLQATLQRVISTQVGGLGTVRTLADLGLKTNRDGSLTLDKTALQKALDKGGDAVNRMFSQVSTGVAAQMKDVSQRYTNTTDGLLSLTRNALGDSIKKLGDQSTTMQARIDSYKTTLIAQFTAMEKIVSGFKSIESFLTSQDKKSGS